MSVPWYCRQSSVRFDYRAYDSFPWRQRAADHRRSSGSDPQRPMVCRLTPRKAAVCSVIERSRDSTLGQTASTLINRLLPAGCESPGVVPIGGYIGQEVGPETLQEEEARNRHRRLAMNGDLTGWNRFSTNNRTLFSSRLGHTFTVRRWKAAFDDVVNGMIKHQAKVMNDTSRTIHFVYKTQSPGGCSRDISPPRPNQSFTNHHLHNHAMFYGRDLYALARLEAASVARHGFAHALRPHRQSRIVALWARAAKEKACARRDHVAADLFQELLAHELREEEKYSEATMATHAGLPLVIILTGFSAKARICRLQTHETSACASRASPIHEMTCNRHCLPRDHWKLRNYTSFFSLLLLKSSQSRSVLPIAEKG